MKLTRRERNALEAVFEHLDRRGITYFVARWYDDLPQSVLGDDVDVLFSAEDFAEGVAVCRRVGFEHHSPSNIATTAELAKRALRNPVRSIDEVASSPAGVL